VSVVYHLFVNGIPKPQPRPRVTSRGHAYNPDSADAWKEEVKFAFLSCRRPTITGPVRLQVSFFLPRPKKLKAEEAGNIHHIKKPDTDNLLKAVMDAMTDVGVWNDDSQVYRSEAGKYYAREKTGAQIIVETTL